MTALIEKTRNVAAFQLVPMTAKPDKAGMWKVEHLICESVFEMNYPRLVLTGQHPCSRCYPMTRAHEIEDGRTAPEVYRAKRVYEGVKNGAQYSDICAAEGISRGLVGRLALLGQILELPGRQPFPVKSTDNNKRSMSSTVGLAAYGDRARDIKGIGIVEARKIVGSAHNKKEAIEGLLMAIGEPFEYEITPK